MFKKIFTYLSCILVLVFLWVISSNAVFTTYSSKSELYLRKNNSNSQILQVDSTLTPQYFYRYGEACEIQLNEFHIDKTLNDFEAKILWTETTEFGESYYAYSPKLKYSCTVNGKKVNLQIFVGKDTVKLASPIIFGSY